MLKERIDIFEIVLLVSCLYIFCPISIVASNPILRLVFSTYLTFTSIRSINSSCRVKLSDLLGIYLLPIFYIIVLFFENPTFGINKVYETYHFFAISTSFFYVIDSYSKENVRKISLILVFFIALTSVTTCIGNILYPNISRLLATSQIEAYMLSLATRLNIAGFEFVYTIMLLIPVCIFVYRQRIYPVIYPIFIVILFILTILKSEYTTALISALLCCLLLFINQSTSTSRIIGTFIFLSIIFILFKGYVADTVSWLSGLIGSDAISVRLADVSATISGEEISDASDLSGRMRLMDQSLSLFVDNPFGTWTYKCGGHSYVADCLARYGILGIIGIVIFCVKYFRVYIRPYIGTPIFLFLLFYYMVYLLQLVMNPQPYLFAITFLIPLFSYTFSDDIYADKQ